jgi:hypothetical protein
MELTNDQKATIEYFREHPGMLVDYIKRSIKYCVARNEELQVSLEGETIV